MKMNIKGLVFVGFAAAVFAGAANAGVGDKIVTSKRYVDGKIVQNIGADDTTHAPSGKVVYDALALKEDVANKLPQGAATGSVITASSTDTEYPTAKAVYNAINEASDVDNFIEDAINDGTMDKAPSENAVYDALALKEDNANKATTIAGNESSDVKYPTTKAVADYLSSGLVPTGTTCSLDNPCALVFDGTAPTWQPIAQY